LEICVLLILLKEVLGASKLMETKAPPGTVGENCVGAGRQFAEKRKEKLTE
jgi:hypothetical protein